MGNKLKKVCVAFGTRPEAIKMGPVIQALNHTELLQSFTLVTGQHRELLSGPLDLFNIEPGVNLDVMTNRQELTDLIGTIVPKAGQVVDEAEVDYLLVHGDTLTTVALALVGYYKGIPVGHVEAGLRSYDLNQPYPEEGNRRLADAIVDVDLPPTPNARKNLLNEGKTKENIIVTGNTVVDALGKVVKRGSLSHDIPDGPYITITMHRRENFEVMGELAEVLSDFARNHTEYTFVYPVHLNPNVRDAVWPVMEDVPNIVLDEPWEYPSMIALLKESKLIITDSGGIQEEGAALDVPVVVLRNVTERPEGLNSSALQVIGNDPKSVRVQLEKLISNNSELEKMRSSPNPFGDGKASERIVSAVKWKLGIGEKPQSWKPTK
jgi:UDP-N-acetylglucosamine 2-epimerase (non-hydrolysing)